MAARLSGHDLSDLCLGKPPLRCLSVTDTVADALAALKRIDDTYVSVWNCHHSFIRKQRKQNNNAKSTFTCTCIGKVCMVDIICFLSSPAAALHSPISALLPDHSALVRHLPPTASLLEAIEVMYEGVQNLVIPIKNKNKVAFACLEDDSNSNINLHDNNSTYCWLTQEDVFRYLLNSIGVFSPTPANPINTLGVIDTQNLFVVCYDDPASSTLDLLSLSLIYQSSVAIVDPQGKFVGEISPFMLNSRDEALVPAIATLSAGDLAAYMDCGGPPEDLVQLVKGRNLTSQLLGDQTGLSSWSSFSSSCSSDEEFPCGKNWKVGGYSAIVCYRWSSLVAVMIQALAHRVSYVWMVEEDGTLTGIVTFQGMLKVFRDHLKSM